MVSFWSFVSGILWFSLILALVCVLHFRTSLLEYGVVLFLTATALGIFRFLVPIDSEKIIVIRSLDALPTLWQKLLLFFEENAALSYILIFAWVLGVIVSAGREILFYVRYTRLLRLGRRPLTPQIRRIAKELNVPETSISVSIAIKSPLSIGLLHPQIYLPDIPLEDDHLRWILQHERYHITHRDSWVKLLFLALRCLLWWDIPVLLFGRVLDDILEVRCDCGVLKGRSAKDRQDYAATLMYVAAWDMNLTGEKPVSSTTFARVNHKQNILVRRTTAIQNMGKRTWRYYLAMTVGVLVCIAVFIGSYCFIVQPYFEAEEIHDGMQLDISPETAYFVHTPEDKYILWYEGKRMGEIPKDVLDTYPHNQLEIIEGTD